jgi:protein-L-isoaspartate(D-aspartate) O-methyltransferase
MVRTQIDARHVTDRRGVRDARVIRAMQEVPRHRFVPASRRSEAYADYPLPIGEGQTISQPYIVAVMTEAARIDPGEKVLEIGTGSGYGAAVASRIAKDVYTIEIVGELARSAKKRLAGLGFANVHVREGDGYRGWPAHAPFHAIIVTAAPDHVPQPLVDQLAVGGRLVIPVGSQGAGQVLKVIERTQEGVHDETLIRVRFVPMTGEAQERD